MNGYTSSEHPWIMRIIVINVIIFMIQNFTSHYIATYSILYDNELIQNSAPALSYYFGLTPALVLKNGYIWQIFTYMFLHGNFLHILANMYALLIFGYHIEQAWGSKKFLIYYLLTGIGAGFTIFVINIIIGGSAYYVPTIGASGAVFGILLAFGILFPNAEILLFFFIPMKAKFLVILYGGMEVILLVTSSGQGNISHVGHLGGIFFGLLYFAFTRKREIRFRSKILQARIKKELAGRSKEKNIQTDDNITILRNILIKIKTSGFNSLNDDEVQRLKYIDIMHDKPDDLCVDEDFNENDTYCSKCANAEACILREIKKFM